MEFKRCDRCGEEIKAAEGIALAWELVCGAVTSLTQKISGKPIITVYRDDKPADLCPDCKKAFDRWMKDGAKSQHPESPEEPKENRTIKTEQIIVAKIPSVEETAGPVKFGDF